MQPVQTCIHSDMKFEETLENAQWVNKKFWILKNFSRILEKFHFSISISRHFHFTFHSRSRSKCIFISLFTLDLDLKAFAFHFSFSKWVNQIFISLFTSRTKSEREIFSLSLLELSISTLAGHWLFSFPRYGQKSKQNTEIQKSLIYFFENPKSPQESGRFDTSGSPVALFIPEI